MNEWNESEREREKDKVFIRWKVRVMIVVRGLGGNFSVVIPVVVQQRCS